MLFFGISRIKSAAFIAALLTLFLFAAGCNKYAKFSAAGLSSTGTNSSSLDSHALSRGKITHFTPMPGLPNNPSDKMLLAAFGLSNLNGSVARSGVVAFQSSNGNSSVSCLVINDHVLVVLEDFTRQAFGWENFSAEPGSSIVVQGPPYNGKPFIQTKKGQVFLYGNSQQYIQIDANSNIAVVGGRPIQLSHIVLWQDGNHPLSGDHVLLLSDLLRLWQKRDGQMGVGQSVRNVKIIYDLRDCHR